jgi:hypothetical protein
MGGGGEEVKSYYYIELIYGSVYYIHTRIIERADGSELLATCKYSRCIVHLLPPPHLPPGASQASQPASHVLHKSVTK